MTGKKGRPNVIGMSFRQLHREATQGSNKGKIDTCSVKSGEGLVKVLTVNHTWGQRWLAGTGVAIASDWEFGILNPLNKEVPAPVLLLYSWFFLLVLGLG